MSSEYESTGSPVVSGKKKVNKRAGIFGYCIPILIHVVSGYVAYQDVSQNGAIHSDLYPVYGYIPDLINSIVRDPDAKLYVHLIMLVCFVGSFYDLTYIYSDSVLYSFTSFAPTFIFCELLYVDTASAISILIIIQILKLYRSMCLDSKNGIHKKYTFKIFFLVLAASLIRLDVVIPIIIVLIYYVYSIVDRRTGFLKFSGFIHSLKLTYQLTVTTALVFSGFLILLKLIPLESIHFSFGYHNIQHTIATPLLWPTIASIILLSFRSKRSLLSDSIFIGVLAAPNVITCTPGIYVAHELILYIFVYLYGASLHHPILLIVINTVLSLLSAKELGKTQN